MSKREYTDPSGSARRIEIDVCGLDDVRVKATSIDHDGNEYAGMVFMPITDLRDMFKEADAEINAKHAACFRACKK